MKPTIPAATALVLLSACTSVPREGSLANLEYDQRLDLIATCMNAPTAFGFPNTRAENADLLTVLPQFAPNVYTYCRQVADYLVR